MQLRSSIESKQTQVAVIGLGYVGLSLAVALADVGFRVWGVDVDETRVGMVSAGDWPLDAQEPHLPVLLKLVVAVGELSATTDYAACADAGVVIVCVPTPITKYKEPDFGALYDAVTKVGDYITPPTLVILESTLAPGTTEAIAQMLPSGTWLAHCPERVTAGWLWYNLHHMLRVIGGYTPEAAILAQALYSTIATTYVFHTTDVLTTEIVKCAENAYRDVQIAFANELAVACDALGADVWEVRRLINTCPGRDVHEPGPGVGGACLTKDSWLLASSLLEPPTLMLTAREINDGMPAYAAELVWDTLVEMGIKHGTVAVLGAAYRRGTSDVRGSPAAKLMIELEKLGANVRFYDPHVDGYDGDLVQTLTGADAAVIATGHDEFRDLDWPALGRVMRQRVLVDLRGIVKERPRGFVFRALGKGRQ